MFVPDSGDERTAKKSEHAYHPTGLTVSRGRTEELVGCVGKNHRTINKVGRVAPFEIWNHQGSMKQEGKFDLPLFAIAEKSKRDFVLLCEFLDEIRETQPQVIAYFDHALVVHGRVANLGDQIPFFERVGSVRAERAMDEYALNR